MKNIAVIIPHYNDVDRLMRCIEALMSQADRSVQIVVADNASTVDLAPVREAWPNVTIVTQPEKGAGPARNAGVAATDAPWLMFIDADCVASPGWLARGRAIADKAAVIGGRVDVFDETEPPKSGAEAFEEVFAFKMQDYLVRDGYLGSGNLVTSRQVFKKTGGFRASVSEDKDWSQRAARAGFRLAYDDKFAVGHPSRQDWTALRLKWRRLTSERFLLEGRKARTSWALRAFFLPASVIVHVPRVLNCAGLTNREKVRALGTLARIRLARMIWMLGQATTGRP